MREGFLGALLQGDKVIWGFMGALWLAAAVLVTARRSSYGPGAPATPLRIFTLLGAGSLLSLLALPFSTALSIPRVRWKSMNAPELYAPTGDTWRKLRGPAVPVVDRGLPDVAVPTLDAQDRWVLWGLLSGRPIEGLAPAPEAPLPAGTPRICGVDEAACRPWPAGWPDPSRPIGTGELVWTKDVTASALAYDAETKQALEAVAGLSEADAPQAGQAPAVLELVGRIAAEPPREGAAVLFLLRRVHEDRLQAVRLVAASGPSGKSFQLQRADVSLTIGPKVMRLVARPVLTLTALSLPLGLAAYLVLTLSRRSREGGAASAEKRRAWLNALSAIAALMAGLGAAMPAVVAIAGLWGSR